MWVMECREVLPNNRLLPIVVGGQVYMEKWTCHPGIRVVSDPNALCPICNKPMTLTHKFENKSIYR